MSAAVPTVNGEQMSTTDTLVIGYHRCSMRCGSCGGTHMSFELDTASLRATARCWEGCTGQGFGDQSDRELMEVHTCPMCGRGRESDGG